MVAENCTFSANLASQQQLKDGAIRENKDCSTKADGTTLLGWFCEILSPHFSFGKRQSRLSGIRLHMSTESTC